MKRVTLVVLAVMLLSGAPAHAYLKLGTTVGGKVVSLKWDSFPIRYFVSNRDVPGVSAQQFRDAVGRAFATWEAVPNTAMSSQFAGFTQASPLDDDNMSVIGFANRPDLDRVLGSTSFTLDVVTGQIVESGHLPELRIRVVGRVRRRPRRGTTSNRSRCTRLAICTGSVTPRSERRS